jgi:hypothetical protein
MIGVLSLSSSTEISAMTRGAEDEILPRSLIRVGTSCRVGGIASKLRDRTLRVFVDTCDGVMCTRKAWLDEAEGTCTPAVESPPEVIERMLRWAQWLVHRPWKRS